MIENIQKRLLGKLPFWEEMKRKLDSTLIVFHRAFSRKRFIHKCLPKHERGSENIGHEYFSCGPPLLEGGRVWGVVVKATKWLLERQEHIQANWNLHRMLGNMDEGNDGTDAEDEENGGCERYSKHFLRANDFITSGFMWALCHLVSLFADLLGAIENWCSGCRCHPRDLREYLGMKISDINCPLRLCRAPDLACGALDRFFTLISSTLVAQVRAAHATTLTAVEQGKIVDYFNFSKQYIYVELVLRVDRGWSALPLRALGMGNEDEEVAKDCLIDCLAQFEAMQPEDMTVFEWTLFARGGPGRGQVIAVVQGTHTFAQVPLVQRYRMISQFLPCMEASVERRHAQIHSSIRAAPNHTAAFTSVQGLRKAEILAELESGVEEASRFSGQGKKKS